ncbi:hypothetical protein [Halorubrum sp. Boch-26]|uniref:DUF7573 domain-containing protein n=1 Tax=Halorubrum sp. Boch-26 TaxID=2994426 RepID=UPI0024683EFE|nr:hypothetical protein [Halorubrum sp. Boch-26]
MPEDRSLDEFAGGDADADGESADVHERRPTDGERGDTDETGEDPDAVEATPAISTATWTTDGAACDRCDERVVRRWLDDGNFVCAGCKEW